MNRVLEAYGQPVFAPTPLFDKVVTLEGDAVDTATYRKENTKEKEVVKKPLVGSRFSQYMDAVI